MGIPSFFRHIISRYADIIVESPSYNGTGTNEICHRLFIDFNCILHKFAQEKSVQCVNLALPLLEEEIMQESIKYVKQMYDFIKPLEFMFVAIDGVCPRAKMTQQRKRRFISNWKKSLVKEDPSYIKDVNQQWDSNVITPGTSFMLKFDHKIKAAFQNEIKSGKIILSGSSEFGEGEHKIYHCLKSLEKENKNDIIYGLDADIILLSLINLDEHKKQTIKLMREYPEFHTTFKTQNQNQNQKKNQNNDFMFLNINTLSSSLFDFYSQQNRNHAGEPIFIENLLHDPMSQKNAFVRDYVILCTFIGNDFLPSLSYLKVHNNGIDNIIREYMKIGENLKQFLVSHNGEINDIFLKKILKSLSINEDEFMNKAQQNNLKRQPDVRQFLNIKSYEKIFKELDNFPLYHKVLPNTIDCSKKEWRVQYYQNLFHGDLVSDICKNYLEGLQWVVNYYINHDSFHDWHYLYCYSPTISDLYNYLEFEIGLKAKMCIQDVFENCKKIRINNVEFESIMKNGLLQLFMVLPSSSSHLIPDQQKAAIMHDIEKGCVHFYPRFFKISTFLKSYLWECSAVLPDIDMNYLHQVLQS